MHAPVPARKQPDTFQLRCLISLLLRHICAGQVQTHSPPGTHKRTHRASISFDHRRDHCLPFFLPACLSSSLCLSLSLCLCLACFPPSSVSVCPPQHALQGTLARTHTHTLTDTHTHTHTHTHTRLLSPRLTDQQHHGDLSTRRTLFAESGWGEEDKTG